MASFGLNACLGRSWPVWFPVTLTLAHSYADEWSGVVAKLYEAFTLFDKRLSKHYAKAGSIGKLKALEAPVGRNGIHPHLHILLTHDASADLAALESAMRSAWSKAVAEVGGVNEHGFDFKAHCVNDYAAKIESAHELASHGTKQARKKGKTLPQLLDRAAVGDKKAGAEWLRAMSALGGACAFMQATCPRSSAYLAPVSGKTKKERRLSMLRRRLSLCRFALHTPSSSTLKRRIQGPGAVVWR